MTLNFDSKTVLVTGSTGGIGLAIADRFAESGAHVIINGRTQSRVDEAVKTLKSKYQNAKISGIAADVATADGFATVAAKFPRVDILVNNLGIFESKSFFEIPDADWTKFFETNVLSGVRAARHYAPLMKEKGWGRVIFISSESSILIPAEMVHYGMTKTAQLAVSRGLAETMKGTGVTVNCVLPGPTRTEGVEEFVAGLGRERGLSPQQMEKEFFKTMRSTSLLQRFIEPAEVANMVAYVASDLASATTGAALRVDGGTAPFIL